VQFDFPFDFAQGKPEKNGKPYKSSGGKMVWNEELKREIPEGWEVKLFGDVVAIKNGRDHKLLNNGTYPVYGSGGVMRQCDTFLYDSESILIPRKGSLGNLFYINEPFWCVDTIFYTQMKFPQSCKYLFYTTQNFNIAKMNTGTAVPSMTTEILNNLTLVFPSSDILKSFDDLLIPIFKKKKIINIENQKLTELRDWLLPMLMNGQVKVMDEMENELSMAAEPKIEYGK
jgi:type I restriction enzyme S subunit